MLARIRAALRWEDAVLLLWVAVALPILAAVVGAGAGSGPAGEATGGGSQAVALDGRPLAGLLLVAGVVGGLIALGTRSAEEPVDRAGPEVAERMGTIGPLFGGMLLIGSTGLEALGVSDEPLMLVALGLVLGLILEASGGAPALPLAVRRLLVLPFVLAGSLLFQQIVSGFDLGPGLLGQVVAAAGGAGAAGGATPDTQPGWVLFVFGMLTAGAAVFYVMLVVAPRRIVEREGGALAWTIRFFAWYGGSLVGLGWLAMLGR